MMKSVILFAVLGQLLLHIHAQDEYVYYEDIDKYYKYHLGPNTWFEARRICESEGGLLAMPENDEEAATMIHHYNLYPSNAYSVSDPNIMFLGFHDLFQQNLFLTLKGDPIQNNFHVWNGGSPSKKPGENCGVLHKDIKLQSYNCETPSIFMCEKSSRNRQTRKPSGYQCSGSNCYKLHLEPRTWVNALSVCQAEGGNLAVVRSKNEQDQITKIFKTIAPFQISHLRYSNIAFIGVHDLFKEGEFVTSQGETLDKIGYSNWDPHQPNGKKQENCVAIEPYGKLHDFDCNLATMFFCQRQKTNADY